MGSPALGRVFSPGAGRPAHRPPATPRSFADGPHRPGAWRARALPRNRRSGRPCLRVPAPDHWLWRPRRVGSSRRTSHVRPRRRGRTASRSRSPSQASRDPSGGVRLQRPPRPGVAPGASHRGRRRTNSRREGRETSLARPVRRRTTLRKIEARPQRPVPGGLHGFPRKSGPPRLGSSWMPAPRPTVPFPGPHQGKSQKWPSQPSLRSRTGRQGL